MTAGLQPGADWTPGEAQPAKWMDPHQRTYYKEATHEAPPTPTRPFDGTAAAPQGHVNKPNSFTGMSSAAEERNAKLQQILNKTLGADFIASRAGGGGSRLNYLEGWRAINLANDVFGFNGWFTDIKYLEADFVDYDPESQRWHVGVTAIVRVRLQDGASHEDVGYGKMENCRSKGEALDKSKKEAVTDALKRALRHFGKLLGNCLYDKHYLEHIKNVKAPKPKLDWDAMYKPERDNVAAMTSASYASYASHATAAPPPPAPLPGGPSAAPAPKREPPGAVPAQFAAKVQRASTVGGIPPQQHQQQQQQQRPPLPQPQNARPLPAAAGGGTAAVTAAPAARPIAAPALQGTTKKPIQRATTVPNPGVRPAPVLAPVAAGPIVGGAPQAPMIPSDDDSLFGAMDLPEVEELLDAGNASMVGGTNTTATAFRDDSGYGEMEGLADTSIAGAIGLEKKPLAVNGGRPSLPPAPDGQGPAQAQTSHAVAESAATLEQREKNRLNALARRAARQKEKELEQQQSGAPAMTADANGPATTTALAQNTSLVSAASLLAERETARLANGQPQQQQQLPALPALGNARPPALRPNQPPQGLPRAGSMQRTTSIGQNIVGQHPPVTGPRVAGSLPSLNVGAGLAKAAAGSSFGAGVAANVGGANGLAFQSARGIKRVASEGEYASPMRPGFASASMTSYPAQHPQHQSYQPQTRRHQSSSPRQALKELHVDETTGDIKRQRTSLG
ncbi:hypothetical protein JCM10908_000512 [Rhodotorula pacifica]|uniref:uncharacterized protein n=1 Tax=Rhodotorula pacifica TaxID=1495444 RepID=UPI003177A0FC